VDGSTPKTPGAPCICNCKKITASKSKNKKQNRNTYEQTAKTLKVKTNRDSWVMLYFLCCSFLVPSSLLTSCIYHNFFRYTAGLTHYDFDLYFLGLSLLIQRQTQNELWTMGTLENDRNDFNHTRRKLFSVTCTICPPPPPPPPQPTNKREKINLRKRVHTAAIAPLWGENTKTHIFDTKGSKTNLIFSRVLFVRTTSSKTGMFGEHSHLFKLQSITCFEAWKETRCNKQNQNQQPNSTNNKQ